MAIRPLEEGRGISYAPTLKYTFVTENIFLHLKQWLASQRFNGSEVLKMVMLWTGWTG